MWFFIFLILKREKLNFVNIKMDVFVIIFDFRQIIRLGDDQMLIVIKNNAYLSVSGSNRFVSGVITIGFIHGDDIVDGDFRSDIMDLGENKSAAGLHTWFLNHLLSSLIAGLITKENL
jgi:hypothetical protein